MASWYYLVAQLPSIPDKVPIGSVAPLPITEAQFLELTGRFLDRGSMTVLRSLSLVPPGKFVKTGSHVVDSWNTAERALRVALAQVRAQKLNKKFAVDVYENKLKTTPVPVLHAARTAMTLESPLAAEQFLNDFRLGVLSDLTPMNSFSTEALYLYALKLKLFERIRKFNEDAGIASYKTIYDQILGETA